MLFIIVTLPGAIISGYYFLELSKTDVGSTILVLADEITFSYNGLNFFILLGTNTKFCAELKNLMKCLLEKIKSIKYK